jgi:hypothetical protein
LNNDISGSSESGVSVDAGYGKLTANFPKVVPILRDATIALAEGFNGDQNGLIIYSTNYSVDEAIRILQQREPV